MNLTPCCYIIICSLGIVNLIYLHIYFVLKFICFNSFPLGGYMVLEKLFEICALL